MTIRKSWEINLLGKKLERSKVLEPGHKESVCFPAGEEDGSPILWDCYSLEVLSSESISLKSFQDWEQKPGMKPDPQILVKEDINDFPNKYSLREHDGKRPIIISYEVGGKERR